MGGLGARHAGALHVGGTYPLPAMIQPARTGCVYWCDQWHLASTARNSTRRLHGWVRWSPACQCIHGFVPAVPNQVCRSCICMVFSNLFQPNRRHGFFFFLLVGARRCLKQHQACICESWTREKSYRECMTEYDIFVCCRGESDAPPSLGLFLWRDLQEEPRKNARPETHHASLHPNLFFFILRFLLLFSFFFIPRSFFLRPPHENPAEGRLTVSSSSSSSPTLVSFLQRVVYCLFHHARSLRVVFLLCFHPSHCRCCLL